MTLTVGPFVAEAGSKIRGVIDADLGTITVRIPVTLIHGTRPGPRVVITGGVHGGEFVGVDATTRLAGLLDPAEVRGQVIICPVANPPAVYQGRLNVSPVDGVNINRVFPGDPDGSPTERIAAWLFENLISGADAYADLHSGGIDQTLCDFVGYRLTGDPDLDAKARAMAHAVGYEYVIFGTDPSGGNSHAAAARQGIPAVLIETGQLGQRDEAAVEKLLGALNRLLHQLDVVAVPPSGGPGSTDGPEWVWVGFVESPATGLWYPDFTRGSDVASGQTIGRVIDPVDGSEHKVVAPVAGRIIYGMQGLTVRQGAHLAEIAAPFTPPSSTA
ncbi:M14 family metallopeptidase [Micromonospora sp. KC213]|uniref:M14 family metallopeptidase n=1 Tax=Micromonospora sp. KC213 TaxID=2530378 RepID=UPI00104E67B6|nr:M14 family metallopeptidase [Micromonospora sp. KC213]TDC42583.1 ethanolamine utilization protein EutE [Micromonospora sp. KC213]